MHDEPYAQRTLMAGEEYLFTKRLSVWRVSATVFWGAFWAFSGFKAFLDGAGYVLFLFGLSLLVYASLSFYYAELQVTTKRLVLSTGILKREIIELRHDQIESIQISQNIFGRLFNYGRITFSGTGNVPLDIAVVDDPLEIRQRCFELARPLEEETFH